MKLKRFKLNAISAEGLLQKEMNAIVGGKDCTCSCYWYGQGGSPDGANSYANYGIGPNGGYSTQGCNQALTTDEFAGYPQGGASGYTKAN